MRIVLEELGYDPNNHRSQGISENLIEWADNIIVMGNVHQNYISEHFPDSLEKVVNWVVKDPHFAVGTELHREVASQIEEKIKQVFL